MPIIRLIFFYLKVLNCLIQNTTLIGVPAVYPRMKSHHVTYILFLLLEVFVILTAYFAAENSWIGPLLIPLINVPINLLALLFFIIYDTNDFDARHKLKGKAREGVEHRDRDSTSLTISAVMMIGLIMFNITEIMAPGRGWPFG